MILDSDLRREARNYQSRLRRFRYRLQGQTICLCTCSGTLLNMAVGLALKPPQLVGAARTEEEGLELVSRLRPSLLMVTEELTRGCGLSLCERVGNLPQPPQRILLLSHLEPQRLQRAWQLGVEGIYLDSDPDGGRPLEALSTVLAGQRYLGPRVARVLKHGSGPVVGLSEAERQLLQHLMEGCSDAEIAAAMGQTVDGVRRMLTMLRERLQARNRVQLVVRGLQYGLVQLPED